MATNESKAGIMKWLIAITVSFAAVMELIDTSIVNVALTDMQGNLGATLSEIGWVVTGYAVANAIVIPLSAWLGDVFGRKRYFVFSLIGFTLSSVLCGMAHTLPVLVAARILQGLCGGGLLAKAQAVLFETFPREEQGQAQALFGIGVIVGPVIGPTLGGFITDTLGWRWIFFINIPFGILAVLMAILFLPSTSPKKTTRVDWLGILLLIVAIGSLQTLLEQGNQEDWFASGLIVTLTAGALIGLIAFVWHELKTDLPAVNLRVLRHKSLAAGSLYSAVLGMGLYGTTFAVPIFAQSVLHFTAMQTGLLMLPGALASAAMMPLIGRLSNKAEPRLLIAFGSVVTAIVMFIMAGISPQTGTSDLFWPLLFRGAGSAFIFMSLSLAAMSSVPKEEIAAASGVYNLTRQLGGSIGIAVLTTVLDRREAFHRAVLVEHLSKYNWQATSYINQMSAVFQQHSGDHAASVSQAMSNLNAMLNLQSMVLSFSDLFWLVGIAFIVTIPLLLLLGSSSKGAGAEAIATH